MSLQVNLDAYFSAIGRRDKQAWLDTFSDQSGLAHADPVGGPVRTSKAELGAFWDLLQSLFAEVHLEVKQVYLALPQRVGLVWLGRGRGNNGVQVEFEGIDIIVGDDQGKILSLEAYWDANATLARLMN